MFSGEANLMSFVTFTVTMMHDTMLNSTVQLLWSQKSAEYRKSGSNGTNFKINVRNTKK